MANIKYNQVFAIIALLMLSMRVDDDMIKATIMFYCVAHILESVIRLS